MSFGEGKRNKAETVYLNGKAEVGALALFVPRQNMNTLYSHLKEVRDLDFEILPHYETGSIYSLLFRFAFA